MALNFSHNFPADDGTRLNRLDSVRHVLKEQIDQGKLGFAKLPFADISEVVSLAESVRNEFRCVIVIGIGGADLGARAAHRALNHQFYNLRSNPRILFVGDTTDPVALQEVLDVVDLRETAVVMVSKSGNTVEQMGTFLILRQRVIDTVGYDASKRHIITITDPEQGALRQITNEEGYRSLHVPQDVGGRFSLLSAMGLFPLALVGVDCREMLKGAECALSCELPVLYAVLQYEAYLAGRRIHVLMPYTYALRDFSFWFRQLWAESLGKAVDRQGNTVNVGPTPIASVGPTDQHSQVQLYREGPDDKTYTFIRAEDAGHDLVIPAAFEHIPNVARLKGQSFAKLLLAEQESTQKALEENGRPTILLSIDKVDAYHIGGLTMFFECATAAMAELLNIDAYNQPGVERGKELMYELLDSCV